MPLRHLAANIDVELADGIDKEQKAHDNRERDEDCVRFFHFFISPPLCHLALAAFLAISMRCCGVNFLALAGPPFNPPRLPIATAIGSFNGVAGLSSGIVFNKHLALCNSVIRLSIKYKIPFFKVFYPPLLVLPEITFVLEILCSLF